MDSIQFSKKDEEIFDRLQKQGPLGKRALFVFQYLFLRREFFDLVRKVREILKIPADGFNPKKEEDIKIFLEKYINNFDFNGEMIIHKSIQFRSENNNDANDLIVKFIEQCGVLSYVPNMLFGEGFVMSIIKEYILFNDFVGIYRGSFASASFAKYNLNSKSSDDCVNDLELKLEVPISVRKDELKDYIDSIWEAIESAKKNVLEKRDFIRFRPRANFVRDLRIFNKYIEIEKLSKKQKKEKGIDYIEIGVLRALKDEGMTNLPDDGTIRSVVSRLRNEIKDKNAFWQEYDDKSLELNQVFPEEF